MSRFFGWNASRGTWYEDDWDHGEDKFILHTRQDVQPVIDYATAQRNSGANDKVGSFSYYATIPAHVELELRQKGINIYNRDHTKRLLQEINQNYPKLKCTNLHHEL